MATPFAAAGARNVFHMPKHCAASADFRLRTTIAPVQQPQRVTCPQVAVLTCPALCCVRWVRFAHHGSAFAAASARHVAHALEVGHRLAEARSERWHLGGLLVVELSSNTLQSMLIDVAVTHMLSM